MATTSRLKEQARTAESRDQWNDAIALYRQVLEESSGEETDVALWNRLGDLHLRVNQTNHAVEAYETAVAAYAEAGLHNNAIALCRKILRLVPGRAAVYLKLGQISAASGFLADARQNFLEYAERMRRAGKLDESFAALKEFADLSPGDADARRLLAEQLAANGRIDQAVEQLRILLGILLDEGDDTAAATVREQIRAVDPTADDSPIRRAAAGRGEQGHDFRTGADPYARLDDDARAGPSSAAPGGEGAEDAPPAGFEPTPGFDTGRYEGDDASSLPAADFEPLDIEPTSLIDEPSSAGIGEELPLIDPDEPAPAPPARERPPLDADEEDGDEDDSEPLPLIGFDDDEEPGAVVPRSIDALRARAQATPEDREAVEGLLNALRARGLDDEVPAVLEANHRALAAAGRYRDAVWPVSELVRLRPDDAGLLQKRVEYAFRGGDRDAQVYAYLDLGRHLAAEGNADKARAVFQRVLELEPAHEEARAAVDAAAAAAAQPPPDDFVDLAALIMDDDAQGPTTRFVVEEREPTGDEDRDFADMLANFRQKVAENIEVEDSSSHYDLGVAFKEMGLVDEAIAQFQVALRGGANPLATLELLGQCFFEKGQFAVGSRVLERALRLPNTGDPELVGVLYLLGRIAESIGDVERALEHFERVVAVDIRFRDTAARLEALRAGTRT
jgi:tetratricopeptide (TPR) repeat protein